MALRRGLIASLVLMALGIGRQAWGQSFGTELHNTLMPASGGMAGTSIARPQDLQSAINGNPATLAQFRGTQFGFGGTWAESTYNLEHAGGVLPNVGAFAAKSEAQGSSVGNIGVTQDLTFLGLPATFGMGFITAAGAGVDFKQVPESNGTSSGMFIFEVVSGLGVDLTDKLSAGASVAVGTGIYDGPFVGLSAMTYDYALRGSLGVEYELMACTNVGAYYQTRQSFTFDNAVQLDLGGGRFSLVQDINMDLPQNFGFGIANSSLMEGRLLLALDVLYKQWDSADLYRSIYDDQWVFQAGAQYSSGKYKLRAGYAYGENPLRSPPGPDAGGVTPPGAVAAIEYLQGQLAVTNQHRLSTGVGVIDALPGVDLDLLAGGMLHSGEQLGAFTATDAESYWIGLGLTWRFCRGACPNQSTTCE